MSKRKPVFILSSKIVRPLLESILSHIEQRSSRIDARLNSIYPRKQESNKEEQMKEYPYKKSLPARDDIPLCSTVLFYRRFLSKQQPCGICERPLSVFEFNAILPCAHIVHVCKLFSFNIEPTI
ncbi:hypothetical protein Y032_0155g3073 [Ancylostoma ceylanicum]|nr:hypothetical protein Y032_0155g3073 [Ancylostoma ceylanicum]